MAADWPRRKPCSADVDRPAGLMSFVNLPIIFLRLNTRHVSHHCKKTPHTYINTVILWTFIIAIHIIKQL